MYWKSTQKDFYKKSGVGLQRCSFRLRRARGKASEREASKSTGLHVFFMYKLGYD